MMPESTSTSLFMLVAIMLSSSALCWPSGLYPTTLRLMPVPAFVGAAAFGLRRIPIPQQRQMPAKAVHERAAIVEGLIAGMERRHDLLFAWPPDRHQSWMTSRMSYRQIMSSFPTRDGSSGADRKRPNTHMPSLGLTVTSATVSSCRRILDPTSTAAKSSL